MVFDGTAITLAELNAYLDERGAAAHARPDLLAPMPSLPTTAVGKIDKKALVARLAPQAQQESVHNPSPNPISHARSDVTLQYPDQT